MERSASFHSFLPPLGINGKIIFYNQFGNRNQFKSFSLKRFNQFIQRLGGVLGAVVAQDD